MNHPQPPFQHEMPTGKACDTRHTAEVCVPMQECNTPDYRQIYAAKFRSTSACRTEAISQAAAASMYHDGLDVAARKALASVSPQNRHRRQALQAELSTHLCRLPYGRGLHNCTPEDLLVYLQMVYVPRHAGSILPSGECVAAPSTVANVVSQLRMTFKELGRGEEWDDHGSHGNLAASIQLSQWCKGHEKISAQAGFQTTGAVPMLEDKIWQLLAHLFHLIQSPNSSAYVRSLAARDGFAFCLMWQTGMRSVNAREIRLEDFLLHGQGRGSLQLYPSSPGAQIHPGMIHVHPQRTKTHVKNPYAISIPPAQEPVMDTYNWLTAVIATAELHGQPVTSYLIRVSDRLLPAPHETGTAHASGPQFLERPLGRSGVRDKLVSQLRSLGIYAGESLLSFRRGMAQFKAAAGQSYKSIKAQLLLQAKHILETVYLPADRHQSGVTRLHSTAGQATPSKP